VNPGSQHEVDGVNSRGQLAALERLHQQDIAAELMNNGATLADPARIDVRGTLVTGQDVLIDINVVFEGTCELGDGVSIGPNCVLRIA
jgi:bifunctional UDP-N-acetylglucosamine pyrophosphorylase/glucosamine-1-phosphate N-acetyltransferase